MGQALAEAAKVIMIVEDDAFIRFDLVDFFQYEGFTVFEAENADDAIVILEGEPAIAIVLTDIQMPGSMDGVKLAHYIRDRFPPTFLIVASGMIRPTPAELPAGAMFIPKPFDPRLVLNAIQNAH